RGNAGVVRPEVLERGKQHWEVLLRDRHRAAVLAIDDRNRRAPVALPRDAPVVEPVLRDALAFALPLEPRHDLSESLALRMAGEGSGVDEMPTLDVGRRLI